jgi:uncharacterized protein YyaL (SSP411 family)
MIERNPLKNDNLKIQRLIEMDKSLLPSDGGPDFNRLIFARSPYLLQHADNPVDWHQWGDEAFARAKREDKPVFLSIGYATCHWCHVMERESFEDRDVAQVLNRDFVSIKVDREERPDIDDQYMTVAQMMMEGGAGWPLSVFLDPDKKPFYAATYIPRQARTGMPGIIDLLEQIAEIWRTQREKVESTCAANIQNLAAKAEPAPAAIPESGIIADAYRHLEMIYDREWGGFGTAPKFPRPLFLSFLLRYWEKGRDSEALAMVERSLQMMRKGGIYDQLGFGFHRYSVDQQWLAPHFEKMLYDQGMLAIAYMQAFQITGKSFYKDVAEEIFAYVRAEMTSPEGGFYSARDADTEGVEGKHYLWTPAEVRTVVDEQATQTVCGLYDITEDGNFEGENIPHLALSVEEFAEREGIPPASLRVDSEEWRKRLLASREERVKPLRDEKVLTAWNGLMIAALSKGFAATGEKRYLDAAANAVNFIRKRLLESNGRLLHCYYAGESSIHGFLEDYSFFIWGLIEMYEATLEEEYLADALTFSKEVLRLFADEFSYGLYDTASDAENVLVRKKSAVDGIVPSVNSVAAMNFLRLGRITLKQKFIKEGEGILRSLMGDLLAQPISYIHSLVALDYLRGPDMDITLVGKRKDLETEEMLRSISIRFIPGLALRFKDPEMENTDYKSVGGRTTAYVCSQGTCRPPVAGRAALEKILDELCA